VHRCRSTGRHRPEEHCRLCPCRALAAVRVSDNPGTETDSVPDIGLDRTVVADRMAAADIPETGTFPGIRKARSRRIQESRMEEVEEGRMVDGCRAVGSRYSELAVATVLVHSARLQR
jgi:hypothetical protein